MTVEALEPQLTMRELLGWGEFEQTFGPITIHERIDAAGALLAHTIAKGTGMKRENGAEVEISDFLPRWEPEATGHVADWLEAMAH